MGKLQLNSVLMPEKQTALFVLPQYYCTGLYLVLECGVILEKLLYQGVISFSEGSTFSYWIRLYDHGFFLELLSIGINLRKPIASGDGPTNLFERFRSRISSRGVVLRLAKRGFGWRSAICIFDVRSIFWPIKESKGIIIGLHAHTEACFFSLIALGSFELAHLRSHKLFFQGSLAPGCFINGLVMQPCRYTNSAPVHNVQLDRYFTRHSSDYHYNHITRRLLLTSSLRHRWKSIYGECPHRSAIERLDFALFCRPE
jgi:hypothetical protein